MPRPIDADALNVRFEELKNNPENTLRDVVFLDGAMSVVDVAPTLDYAPVQKIDGNTSDGYHTFNELYHHRAVLFSVVVKSFPNKAWKARKHHDGSMYDGMFIVGIETPEGQATYHYDIDPYWDMFNCKELERAPEWDGHTSEQAIERIASLRLMEPVKKAAPVKCGEWVTKPDGFIPADIYCSECGRRYNFFYNPNYCPNCGAKMDGGESHA